MTTEMTPAQTPHSPSVLRSSLSLLTIPLILQQIGLALLVFLLYALWLRVPDASAIEVLASLLLALIILAIAGAGEAALILRLAGTLRTPIRLLRGALLLLAGFTLWFAWIALLAHLHGNDILLAGYLNSRFPASMRNTFSFLHIIVWLGWVWTELNWLGATIIALFVFVTTASTQPLRAMLRALRSLTYWLAALLGTIAATALTGALTLWTPGHGLRIEMLSLILRLGLAILVNATAVCLLLSILAVCVRRTDALYSTPAGTPDDSQPLTVDNP